MSASNASCILVENPMMEANVFLQIRNKVWCVFDDPFENIIHSRSDVTGFIVTNDTQDRSSDVLVVLSERPVTLTSIAGCLGKV